MTGAWAALAAVDEPSTRRMQDCALADFFRYYVAPFHPFTRHFYETHGMRFGAVHSVETLGKLPFLSKHDLLPTPQAPDRPRQFIIQPTPELLRQCWPVWKLLPVALNKQAFRESFYPVLMTATTGRSADPVPFIYTPRDIEVLKLAGRRLVDAFGLAYPDHVLSFFPYAPHLAFWQCCIAGFAANVFMVQTGGGKVVGTEGNLKMLDKIKPTAIIGVPSYTYHVLREARAANISTASVQKVILGAEKVPPGMKRKMIAILEEGGAKKPVVFSTYAFTEAKKAWGECPTSDPDVASGYHLTPDLDLVQIVDPVTGRILPAETPGEIVYTPLRGAGTQVWRYRTGDIAEGGITYRPCPHCGRRTPRLLGPISRVSNIKDLKLTKIKGTLVDLNNIAGILDGASDIEEWQVEIRKKNDDPLEVDELALYVALRSGAAESEAMDRIGKQIRAAFEVGFNEMRALPLREMLDRVKMETSLKEVRFLDVRPK